MKLPPPPWADEGDLDAALRRASALVASSAGYALALDQFGIELPPLAAGRIDQAQLRAIASLYLASDLEDAGMVSCAETLASLVCRAALELDLGRATPLLYSFWQSRNERPNRQERAHSFSNLFGSNGAGPVFEEGLLSLCDTLNALPASVGRAGYGMAEMARVRGAASRLLTQLCNGASGALVFLAQEILQTLREAIRILTHPQLLAAFGARDVWAVIGRIDRLTHATHGEPRQYAQRGKAGMAVLSWLADVAPQLDDHARVLLEPGDAVISAALDWVEAALAIGEASAAREPTALGSSLAAHSA